jgi:hypothetical protein
MTRADESISSFLARTNASCYEASRVNLSYHWEVLYHPKFTGRASIIPLILIFVAGVPLNLYIVIAMIYKRLYTQPTYLLLLNLGFSDLLSCFVPILFGIITGLMGEVNFGDNDYIRCQICKISAGYMLMVFLHSFNIVLLSLERLAFFLSPLRYKTSVTPRRTVVVVMIIWLVSIGFTIPPLLGYGDAVFGLWCGFVFSSQPHIARGLVYFGLCAIFGVLCLTLLVVSNIWIGVIAIKSMIKVKNIHTNVTPDHAVRVTTRTVKKSHVQKKKMSITIAHRQLRFFQIFGCILVVNIITRLPIIALTVVYMIDADVAEAKTIVTVQIAQLLQVVIHPVLETLIAPELRYAIVSHCTYCCPNIHSTKIGKCLSETFNWLSECFKPSLWTKALEEEIWHVNFMDEFSSQPYTITSSGSTAADSNLLTDSSILPPITNPPIIVADSGHLPAVADLPVITDIIDANASSIVLESPLLKKEECS